MVITIKLDAKLAAVSTCCVGVAMLAVWMAFPGARFWASENSSDIASWVQAIGSILAILATWFIASSQQRASRENELRLAALDAATMYADLSSVVLSLDKTHSILGHMLDNRSHLTDFAVQELISQLHFLNVRPLNEQSKMAPVGSDYLGAVSEILQQITNMKDAADHAFSIFRHMRDVGFDHLEDLLNEIEIVQRNCFNASEILRSFTEGQGIPLIRPMPAVSAFARRLANKHA